MYEKEKNSSLFSLSFFCFFPSFSNLLLFEGVTKKIRKLIQGPRVIWVQFKCSKIPMFSSLIKKKKYKKIFEKKFKEGRKKRNKNPRELASNEQSCIHTTCVRIIGVNFNCPG